MANRSKKKSLGIRLTEDAVNLLKEMATRTGLSQTSVIELAVREKAARDGVKLEGEAAST